MVAGGILLIAGLTVLGTIDHTTPYWYVGLGMLAMGLGMGMTMQNLVLAVQNTVDVSEIGASSATVSFFRSLGGAVGVSVLGAVLAVRVKDLIIQGLLAGPVVRRPRKLQEGGSGSTSLLDVDHLPPQLAELVRQSYGDATGRIFLIAAACAVVSLIACSSSRRSHSAGPSPRSRSRTSRARWLQAVEAAGADDGGGSATGRRGSRRPLRRARSRTPIQVPRRPPTTAPSGRTP